MILKPIEFKKSSTIYYQLLSSAEVELSQNTVAGVDPFDLSSSSSGRSLILPGGYQLSLDSEIYNCPNGDTIGLNLLSIPIILNCSNIHENDFLVSKQKLGVKRGLLRPEPLYFCSAAFKQIIQDENMSGFSFEIANIE